MTKRTILILASVLALALGVAACGDDDDETTGATTTTAEKAPAAAEENIVVLAQQTPDLSTLVKAVSAAGLVETLEEPGQRREGGDPRRRSLKRRRPCDRRSPDPAGSLSGNLR
jgi:hypothetical protein